MLVATVDNLGPYQHGALNVYTDSGDSSVWRHHLRINVIPLLLLLLLLLAVLLFSSLGLGLASVVSITPLLVYQSIV